MVHLLWELRYALRVARKGVVAEQFPMPYVRVDAAE